VALLGQVHPEHSAAHSAAMTMAHAVAAVLLAWWLRRGEASAWRAVQVAWLRVVEQFGFVSFVAPGPGPRSGRRPDPPVAGGVHRIGATGPRTSLPLSATGTRCRPRTTSQAA
jgi:hypothetical protein